MVGQSLRKLTNFQHLCCQKMSSKKKEATTFVGVSILYNNGLESEARVVKMNFLPLKQNVCFWRRIREPFGPFEDFLLTLKNCVSFTPQVFSGTDVHWKKNEWVVVVSFEMMNCETTTMAILEDPICMKPVSLRFFKVVFHFLPW